MSYKQIRYSYTCYYCFVATILLILLLSLNESIVIHWNILKYNTMAHTYYDGSKTLSMALSHLKMNIMLLNEFYELFPPLEPKRRLGQRCMHDLVNQHLAHGREIILNESPRGRKHASWYLVKILATSIWCIFHRKYIQND